MLDRRWLAVALALIALGCGARYRGARAARGPDGRAMVRLERQAQRDMMCRQPLHVVPLEPRVYQVDGCGQVREYAWSCPGRRCAFQPMVPALSRASQDLQCPPEQLTAQADSATHRAFFGCMRGAAYTLLCVDHGCTWSRTPESVTLATAATSASVVVPATAVTDPTLEAVVIPPPPGAPSAFDAPPPPSSTPPPTTVPAPAPAAPAPSDTVVIPPPPT